MARSLQTNGVQQVQFTNTFRIEKVPVLGDIPVLGNLFFRNCYITTYIGFAILIISAVVLYKTEVCLRLQALAASIRGGGFGRHQRLPDALRGLCLSPARWAVWAAWSFVIPTSTNFNATVAGYGFLALAVLIFGQWKPVRVLLAALFFGLMKTLASAYSGIPFLASLSIPSDFYKMFPYVATLVVLAFTSKNSQAPKASGVPYDKGGR